MFGRLLAAMLLAGAGTAGAAPLQPCWLPGVEHEAQCGQLQRPLDPAQPQGRQITLHYAVLPALARQRRPDPLVFVAGGPGQSAIDLAGPLSQQFARFLNRRDLVLIDQRGTGRSAPLVCDDDSAGRPLAEQFDSARQTAELLRCRDRLQALPHGDLRFYTTDIAVADIEAVRQALAAPQLNLAGASYGTRVALAYLHRYPQAVRRTVLDGVAPPDMVLPAAAGADNQAALEATFAACEREPACAQRHPVLRRQWQQLLSGLPRPVRITHPVSGRVESLTLTRERLLGLVRMPLYLPALAAALPAAIGQAAEGRFEALAALALAVQGSGPGHSVAQGMHFSVVCSEDMPRLAAAAPAGDFGDSALRQYQEVCAHWPRGNVPASFYEIAPARSAVLLLSGGLDPATPPRHAERVVKALGPRARHVVVPNAGHGVMAIGCMRDVLFRFIDAASDDAAMRVDAGCAVPIPRPPMRVAE
jgi:pimeloyl-ACP methyl ester carboxylesterase